MQHKYYTADVFTDQPFGGNQLAVFTDAASIPGEVMQQVARELNLSETVFVLPPDNPAHTSRLRIFTPAVEMPFAGHPTVGTAYVLAAIGAIELSGDRTHILFEEGVGPVPVSIFAQDGIVTHTQLTAARAPEANPSPVRPELVAEILGVEPSELADDLCLPGVVSCGVPFLFVTVRNRQILARTRVNRALFDAHLAGTLGEQIFVLCFDPELEDSHIRARMYAPEFGIAEDPATGSAVAALGGYLGARLGKEGTFTRRIEQGFEMGRPSILELEAELSDGVVGRVRVGGKSVLMSEGWMNLPENKP